MLDIRWSSVNKRFTNAETENRYKLFRTFTGVVSWKSLSGFCISWTVGKSWEDFIFFRSGLTQTRVVIVYDPRVYYISIEVDRIVECSLVWNKKLMYEVGKEWTCWVETEGPSTVIHSYYTLSALDDVLEKKGLQRIVDSEIYSRSFFNLRVS